MEGASRRHPRVALCCGELCLLCWQAATPTWVDRSPSGTSPSARYFHSAVVTTAGEMWVFGGDNSSQVLGDSCMLVERAEGF